MSTTHQSYIQLHDQDVLGELLHSLSQPLTSLRCSLELSLDEAAERPQAAVGIALQQTERVIAMIQLMREYLDTEQPGENSRILLDGVLRTVVDGLTSVAEVRGVELRLEGACSASVCLAEPRLRLALQYLTGALVERATEGGRVLLRLVEGSTESALRAEIEEEVEEAARADKANSARGRHAASNQGTLRMARLAIARRMLEAGGTFLTIEDGDQPGFVLRIPRMLAASRAVV